VCDFEEIAAHGTAIDGRGEGMLPLTSGDAAKPGSIGHVVTFTSPVTGWPADGRRAIMLTASGYGCGEV
jgi:hypothetical protein